MSGHPTGDLLGVPDAAHEICVGQDQIPFRLGKNRAVLLIAFQEPNGGGDVMSQPFRIAGGCVQDDLLLYFNGNHGINIAIQTLKTAAFQMFRKMSQLPKLPVAMLNPNGIRKPAKKQPLVWARFDHVGVVGKYELRLTNRGRDTHGFVLPDIPIVTIGRVHYCASPFRRDAARRAGGVTQRWI